MKGLPEIWSSFPPEHKKRFWQAIILYVLIVAGASSWVSLRAAETLKEWKSRIPTATADVRRLGTMPQTAEQQSNGEPAPSVNAFLTGVPDGANAPAPDGRTYIALVVTGLGLSAPMTEKALETLPPGVTLAFSPYADNLQDWIRKSKVARHETLLALPMESADFPQSDPGPRALSSRLSDDANTKNMEWALTRGKGAAGVINMMGSRFMTDKRRLSLVFNTLKQNDAIFIETPAVKNSVAAPIAADAKLPFIAADMQIDATATDAEIRQKLDQLVTIAKERGYAVGVAESYPVSFNTVKSWAARLADNDVVLAPVSKVWTNKASVTAPSVSPAPQPPADQLQQPDAEQPAQP